MINHWVPIVDDDVGALRMWSVMLLDILVGCETHFYYYFFFFFCNRLTFINDVYY